MSRIAGCGLTLAAAIVSRCGGTSVYTRPVLSPRVPGTSLAYGYIDMKAAPAKLRWVELSGGPKHRPRTRYVAHVRANTFVAENLPDGSYSVSAFGGSSGGEPVLLGMLGFRRFVDFRFDVPPRSRSQRVTIEGPGAYFMGTYRYVPLEAPLPADAGWVRIVRSWGRARAEGVIRRAGGFRLQRAPAPPQHVIRKAAARLAKGTRWRGFFGQDAKDSRLDWGFKERPPPTRPRPSRAFVPRSSAYKARRSAASGVSAPVVPAAPGSRREDVTARTVSPSSLAASSARLAPSRQRSVGSAMAIPAPKPQDEQARVSQVAAKAAAFLSCHVEGVSVRRQGRTDYVARGCGRSIRYECASRLSCCAYLYPGIELLSADPSNAVTSTVSVVGRLEVASDALSKPAIEQVVRSHLAELRVCHAALATNAARGGHLAARFVIGPYGSTHSVDFGESNLGSVEVRRCISRMLLSWVFPRPVDGRSVQVTLPLLGTRQQANSMDSAGDRSVVSQVVHSHRQEVRACYAQVLEKAEPAEGLVSVRFTITPSGEVERANLAASSMGDPDVERCIVRAVRSWRFPALATLGSTTVTYPWVLNLDPAQDTACY